jgi:hypothetical protein
MLRSNRSIGQFGGVMRRMPSTLTITGTRPSFDFKNAREFAPLFYTHKVDVG